MMERKVAVPDRDGRAEFPECGSVDGVGSARVRVDRVGGVLIPKRN